MMGLKISNISKSGPWMLIMINDNQWPLLLTWFNFNPNMDNQLHAQKSVGWNDLSIPKLQRLQPLKFRNG